MSSLSSAQRAAVARLLGAQIFSCAGCGLIGDDDQSLRVVRSCLHQAEHVEHVCSTFCAIKYADCFPFHSFAVLFRKRTNWDMEPWVRIGERGLPRERGLPNQVWFWTDTGNAMWIRENADRLRAAGETE